MLVKNILHKCNYDLKEIKQKERERRREKKRIILGGITYKSSIQVDLVDVLITRHACREF